MHCGRPLSSVRWCGPLGDSRQQHAATWEHHVQFLVLFGMGKDTVSGAPQRQQVCGTLETRDEGPRLWSQRPSHL